MTEQTDSRTIVVTSGKGGVGKTMVALSLAVTAPRPARLLDCDVEVPDCRLFLRPEIEDVRTVGIPTPRIDEAACVGCGECARVCRFHAIAMLKDRPLVFADLCHGCGACAPVCAAGAIREEERPIGFTERGRRGDLEYGAGCLNIAQPMSPPLIRAVRRLPTRRPLTIVDGPPGASCPMVSSARGADFLLLVAEPTRFGLNDLRLAVEVARALAIPFGVVINRDGMGDRRVEEYCQEDGVALLRGIPEDARIAGAVSRGAIAAEALPDLRPLFEDLHRAIAAAAGWTETIGEGLACASTK